MTIKLNKENKDKVLELLLQKAEELNWKVDYKKEEATITFSRFSPEGQEYSFTINVYSSIYATIENIWEYVESYDISYETYIWLDNFGHGKDGAPYDMKDVYEDMEWCLEKTKDLYGAMIDCMDN